MTDAPERIALRWEKGAAVANGPLMDHPDFTQYVRADRIEELEERLKAATDDAKEAEAYAGELEANLALAVDALGDVMRHENSNFFGVNREASRRASWRGVRRKVAKTLAKLSNKTDLLLPQEGGKP